MTSEEYVRSIYPQSRSLKVVSGRIKGLQQTHWIVYKNYEFGSKIGEGKTEAKAWKDAKDYIFIKNQNKTPI